eukprot:gene6705-8302_t
MKKIFILNQVIDISTSTIENEESLVGDFRNNTYYHLFTPYSNSNCQGSPSGYGFGIVQDKCAKLFPGYCFDLQRYTSGGSIFYYNSTSPYGIISDNDCSHSIYQYDYSRNNYCNQNSPLLSSYANFYTAKIGFAQEVIPSNVVVFKFFDPSSSCNTVRSFMFATSDWIQISHGNDSKSVETTYYCNSKKQPVQKSCSTVNRKSKCTEQIQQQQQQDKIKKTTSNSIRTLPLLNSTVHIEILKKLISDKDVYWRSIIDYALTCKSWFNFIEKNNIDNRYFTWCGELEVYKIKDLELVFSKYDPDNERHRNTKELVENVKNICYDGGSLKWFKNVKYIYFVISPSIYEKFPFMLDQLMEIMKLEPCTIRSFHFDLFGNAGDTAEGLKAIENKVQEFYQLVSKHLKKLKFEIEMNVLCNGFKVLINGLKYLVKSKTKIYFNIILEDMETSFFETIGPIIPFIPSLNIYKIGFSFIPEQYFDIAIKMLQSSLGTLKVFHIIVPIRAIWNTLSQSKILQDLKIQSIPTHEKKIQFGSTLKKLEIHSETHNSDIGFTKFLEVNEKVFKSLKSFKFIVADIAEENKYFFRIVSRFLQSQSNLEKLYLDFSFTTESLNTDVEFPIYKQLEELSKTILGLKNLRRLKIKNRLDDLLEDEFVDSVINLVPQFINSPSFELILLSLPLSYRSKIVSFKSLVPVEINITSNNLNCSEKISIKKIYTF